MPKYAADEYVVSGVLLTFYIDITTWKLTETLSTSPTLCGGNLPHRGPAMQIVSDFVAVCLFNKQSRLPQFETPSHVTTRSPYIVYTKRKQFNYRTLNEYIAQCMIFSKSSHLTKKIAPCMSVPRAAKLYFRMCKIIEIVVSLSIHRCHNSVTNVKITYIRPWTTRPSCLVKATVVYIIFKRPVNFNSGHFHNKPYLGSRVAPRVRPKGNPSTCLMHCPAEVTYNEKLAA